MHGCSLHSSSSLEKQHTRNAGNSVPDSWAVWSIIPVWKKSQAAWKQEADPPVIIRQISRKIHGNIDPPAFRPFRPDDIQIPLIQMQVFVGKGAGLFTAEPAAVQKPEHSREHQGASF